MSKKLGVGGVFKAIAGAGIMAGGAAVALTGVGTLAGAALIGAGARVAGSGLSDLNETKTGDAIAAGEAAVARTIGSGGAAVRSVTETAALKARTKRVIGQLQEQYEAGAISDEEFVLRAQSVLAKAQLDATVIDEALAIRLSKYGKGRYASQPRSFTTPADHRAQTGSSGGKEWFRCACGNDLLGSASRCGRCGRTRENWRPA